MAKVVKQTNKTQNKNPKDQFGLDDVEELDSSFDETELSFIPKEGRKSLSSGAMRSFGGFDD